MPGSVWARTSALLTLAGVGLGSLHYIGLTGGGRWISALNLGLLAVLVYRLSPRLLHALDHGRHGGDSAFVRDPAARLGLLLATVPWFLVWLPHASFFGAGEVLGWRVGPADPFAALGWMLGLLCLSAAIVGSCLLGVDPTGHGPLGRVLENGYSFAGERTAEREIEDFREAASNARPTRWDRAIVAVHTFAGGAIVTLPLVILGLTAALAWNAEAFVYLGAGVSAAGQLLGTGDRSLAGIGRAAQQPQEALFAWRVRELDLPRMFALLFIVGAGLVTIVGYAGILASLLPGLVELGVTAVGGALGAILDGAPENAAAVTDPLLGPAVACSLLLSASAISLAAWTRLARRLSAWPGEDIDANHDVAPLPPASDVLYPLTHLAVGATMLALSRGWGQGGWSPLDGVPRLLVSLGGLAVGILLAIGPAVAAAWTWLRQPPRGGDATGDPVRIIAYALAPVAAFAIAPGDTLTPAVLGGVMVIAYTLPFSESWLRGTVPAGLTASLVSSAWTTIVLTVVVGSTMLLFDWPFWILALPAAAAVAMVSADLVDHRRSSREA